MKVKTTVLVRSINQSGQSILKEISGQELKIIFLKKKTPKRGTPLFYGEPYSGKFLKAVASAALSCALAASSLLGVFAAEGIRTVDRSSVQWAKSVSYNYPLGTKTVSFSAGLGFPKHYFKLKSESGNVNDANHLAFCIEPEKGVELSSSGNIVSTEATQNDRYMRLSADTRRLFKRYLPIRPTLSRSWRLPRATKKMKLSLNSRIPARKMQVIKKSIVPYARKTPEMTLSALF